jgi:hypothetical protein
MTVGLALLVAIAGGRCRRAERPEGAKQTRALWTGVAATPRPARAGPRLAIRPDRFRSFRLNRSGLRSALARAPRESAAAAPLVISPPAPGGGFQRLAVELSPVMEPALARSARPPPATAASPGLPTSASHSSASAFFDRDVLETVPPYCARASTSLSTVTFSAITTTADFRRPQAARPPR